MGHRFAMQETPIVSDRFQRVANSMSKVQDSPNASLALVLFHYSGLQRTTACDQMFEFLRFEAFQSIDFTRDPTKQLTVQDDSILDRLVETALRLAGRKRAEHVRVNQDKSRLMERSYEVLAERVIDAGLSADRTVYLCQQGSRNLDQTKPAKIGSGNEPGEITNDAASQRNDDIGSFDAMLYQETK
jgi:hypothetical protein